MVRVRVMVRVRFNDKVLNCSIWSTLALYMCTVLTLTLTLIHDGIGHCLFAIYCRSHWYVYHDMQPAPS